MRNNWERSYKIKIDDKTHQTFISRRGRIITRYIEGRPNAPNFIIHDGDDIIELRWVNERGAAHKLDGPARIIKIGKYRRLTWYRDGYIIGDEKPFDVIACIEENPLPYRFLNGQEIDFDAAPLFVLSDLAAALA